MLERKPLGCVDRASRLGAATSVSSSEGTSSVGRAHRVQPDLPCRVRRGANAKGCLQRLGQDSRVRARRQLRQPADEGAGHVVACAFEPVEVRLCAAAVEPVDARAQNGSRRSHRLVFLRGGDLERGLEKRQQPVELVGQCSQGRSRAGRSRRTVLRAEEASLEAVDRRSSGRGRAPASPRARPRSARRPSASRPPPTGADPHAAEAARGEAKPPSRRRPRARTRGGGPGWPSSAPECSRAGRRGGSLRWMRPPGNR